MKFRRETCQVRKHEEQGEKRKKKLNWYQRLGAFTAWVRRCVTRAVAFASTRVENACPEYLVFYFFLPSFCPSLLASLPSPPVARRPQVLQQLLYGVRSMEVGTITMQLQLFCCLSLVKLHVSFPPFLRFCACRIFAHNTPPPIETLEPSRLKKKKEAKGWKQDVSVPT